MSRRSAVMFVLSMAATSAIVEAFGLAAGLTWALGIFVGGFVRGGWRL